MSFNKPYGIIYKATNLINDKTYIGQTIKTLKNRIKRHFYTLKYDDNVFFHNALRKYGIENFKWEVLIECSSRAVLNEMETLMIIEHISFYKFGKGYNLTWGDKGSNGYKHSQKTIKKLKENLKGHVVTEETKKKISKSLIGHIGANKGGKRPDISGNNSPAKRPEVREKISKARKGHVVTEETRKKIGERNKGKTFSSETRKKMSDAQKGRIPWNKGIPCSEEQKRKISNTQKGRIPWNKGKRKKCND